MLFPEEASWNTEPNYTGSDDVETYETNLVGVKEHFNSSLSSPNIPTHSLTCTGSWMKWQKKHHIKDITPQSSS